MQQKNRRRPNWAAWAPPGANLAGQRQMLRGGLLGAVLYSVGFLVRYTNARAELFVVVGGEKMLRPGAVIPAFDSLLGSALLGFVAAAAAMLFFIAYYYSYHWQGSKSIYLMRRLPDRWELARRCLALPVLGALACLLAGALVLGLYYGVYRLFTPEECLLSYGWQEIGSVLL